jgi:hypothetical protein
LQALSPPVFITSKKNACSANFHQETSQQPKRRKEEEEEENNPEI